MIHQKIWMWSRSGCWIGKWKTKSFRKNRIRNYFEWESTGAWKQILGITAYLWNELRSESPKVRDPSIFKGSFMNPLCLTAEINLWRQFSILRADIMRQSRTHQLLNNLRVGEFNTHQLELLHQRRRISWSGEFADGITLLTYPTAKPVHAYINTMTAKNRKTHRDYMINAVSESCEIEIYEKTYTW